MSDEAVEAKTGQSWDEWFTLLDAWDAGEKGHKATARHLADEHGLSPWWSQTVTVEYERERGLRVRGQRGGEFVVTVQRTIAASPERLYEAVTEPELLSQWFTQEARADLVVGGNYDNSDGDRGEFLILESPRRVRFTWENPEHAPGTLVDVAIQPRDSSKSTIRLEHSKLRTKDEFEDLKEGWSWAMDSLKSFLEKGDPIGFDEWQGRAGR